MGYRSGSPRQAFTFESVHRTMYAKWCALLLVMVAFLVCVQLRDCVASCMKENNGLGTNDKQSRRLSIGVAIGYGEAGDVDRGEACP